MNPSELIDGIREYTNNGSSVYLDNVREAEYMIQDITGFILGLIAIFISFGMTLISALDICYITIPVFQDMIKDKKWDGSPDGSNFRIISGAARVAVETTSGTGESPLKFYMKKRIGMYCFCGLVLSIAILGFGTITGIVSNIVLSIVEGLRRVGLPL